MDTSHLAEHAGAASSFFASMFVVATLSMRTMIPLRVSEHAQLRANGSRERVMSQCRPRLVRNCARERGPITTNAC